jgi:hypothetical protein
MLIAHKLVTGIIVWGSAVPVGLNNGHLDGVDVFMTLTMDNDVTRIQTGKRLVLA